ncbi:MAG: septum formation initiator family protein [Anaerovoracaceae bacterium]
MGDNQKDIETTSGVIDFEQAREEREKEKKAKSFKAKHRRSIKKVRRTLVYFIIISSLVAMVGFSLYHIISLKIEARDLEAQRVALEKQKADLEAEKETVNEPEYIEQQARKLLRLIMPGETLYILPTEEGESSEK